MICEAECTKHRDTATQCCVQVMPTSGTLREYIHLAHTALPHPCQTPQGVSWNKETNECLTIKMRKQMSIPDPRDDMKNTKVNQCICRLRSQQLTQ